jgi:hypothetical protein
VSGKPPRRDERRRFRDARAACSSAMWKIACFTNSCPRYWPITNGCRRQGGELAGPKIIRRTRREWQKKAEKQKIIILVCEHRKR